MALGRHYYQGAGPPAPNRIRGIGGGGRPRVHFCGSIFRAIKKSPQHVCTHKRGALWRWAAPFTHQGGRPRRPLHCLTKTHPKRGCTKWSIYSFWGGLQKGFFVSPVFFFLGTSSNVIFCSPPPRGQPTNLVSFKKQKKRTKKTREQKHAKKHEKNMGGVVFSNLV